MMGRVVSMDNNSLWKKVLDEISVNLDSMSFETWFNGIDFFDIKDNSIRLVVPIMFYKNHIDELYKQLILDSFNKLLTNPVDNIVYILQKDLNSILEVEKKENEPVKINDFNSYNNFNSNLKSNYTFESFVVGESNKFAQAAALAVAENPGTMYNPLFIYGNSGLGKTHLMHAIGNFIVNKQKLRVLYVTCDNFMNDFVGLSRNNQQNMNNLDYIEFFKNKYRNIDVLIIDDIQFLGGAEKSQQEFFHTFNNLYNDSKQIIVSSDRSPEDLKFLEDRLKTRFCWGLQVDIDPPDTSLKVAIIKKKIRGENIILNDDVVNYIASNVGNDVRQLEGSINRLVAYSAIMNESNITVDFAMEALKDFTKKQVTDSNNIRRIQKEVANFYKISYEDMKSKKRTPSLAIPRQVAMYLCRKLTDESYERIGIEFSGKNHATVIHACNKIAGEMKTNSSLKSAIDDIEKQLT